MKACCGPSHSHNGEGQFCCPCRANGLGLGRTQDKIPSKDKIPDANVDGRQGPEGVRSREGACSFGVCLSVQLGRQPQESIGTVTWISGTAFTAKGPQEYRNILMLLEKSRSWLCHFPANRAGTCGPQTLSGCGRAEQEARSLWATGMQILMHGQVCLFCGTEG